jgi:hypothetical protein
MDTHQRRRRGRRALIVAVAASSCALLIEATAASAAVGSPAKTTKVTPVTWIKLGLSQTAPAELWRGPDGRDWVVWASQTSARYEQATISATGHVIVKPKTIISGWSGVTADPTLLAHGKEPLLVFSGQDVSGPLADGCAVGALPASPRWTIQSWSLSANCVFSNVGYGDASENKSGKLSAAWAGGLGVEYRLASSPVIPASTPDEQISLPSAHADSVAEADNRAGNDHIYVAFDRFFSKTASKNGVYVKDLTGNGPVLKAPSSGTESVTFPAQPQRVAFSGAIGHAGIYAAYCSNAGTCDKLLLWRVGSSKTVTIPASRRGLGLAMSAGPGGRLWLAWYNEQANRVELVMTNPKETGFGPVRSFRVPCFADGNTHLALGGGSQASVDVALECLSASQTKPTVFVAHVHA